MRVSDQAHVALSNFRLTYEGKGIEGFGAYVVGRKGINKRKVMNWAYGTSEWLHPALIQH